MKLLKRIIMCLALIIGGVAISEFATVPCHAQSSGTFTRTFKGKIGGKYAITVNLTIPNQIRPGSTVNVSGTYWYGNGKNGKMRLKGTLSYGGRMALKEYNPKGQQCGVWDVSLDFDEYGAYITGAMQNAKRTVYTVDCYAHYPSR